MPAHSLRARCLTFGRATAACVLLITASPGQAQRGGLFAGLSGSWSGSGTVELQGGGTERIRCRATYTVAGDGANLQNSLRCASDSFRFDLSGNLIAQGGTVSGTWTETTRGAGGSVSGRASGGQFDLRVDSPGFAANLAVTTKGDRQSISIRSQGTELSGATITLARGG